MNKNFNPKSHIGETHGIYTIIDMLDKKDKYGHWIYKSVCNKCGFIKYSSYGNIASPSKIVTQCLHVEIHGNYMIYHNYTWSNKRIAGIFYKMMERCYNNSSDDYRWYGAKGIGVYEKWRDNPSLFEEWSINNGYKNNLTIDRINSSMDYCPENCQWITREENSRKAGKVTWITVGNETLTGRQWSEKLGLGINSINTFIRQRGIEKTKELIIAMLHDPISNHNRNPKQSWFSEYGI